MFPVYLGAKSRLLAPGFVCVCLLMRRCPLMPTGESSALGTPVVTLVPQLALTGPDVEYLSRALVPLRTGFKSSPTSYPE